MESTILLVRHASHPLLGRTLCGRMPGVSLDDAGRAQAARLGARIAARAPAAIHTSPLERARETADLLAEACGCPVLPCDGLNEIDFGAWSGQDFPALADDPRWTTWNEARATSRPPGGESMVEAQVRVVAALDGLRRRHPGRVVVAVSHADVIKAAILWAVGASLDAYHRIEIGPAGVSALALRDGGATLLSMNEGLA
ncbi:histidine phosphatase family protein [Roseicella aquatilis]|uniref:Histidine phosphatase family protein n=1 Tax=Roseicella aquatilis TaxID=2527868 RepID=A0A4R4DJG9_9PROT|nr:histidine phosphatase family protein [Roseicella aquatilis]